MQSGRIDQKLEIEGQAGEKSIDSVNRVIGIQFQMFIFGLGVFIRIGLWPVEACGMRAPENIDQADRPQRPCAEIGADVEAFGVAEKQTGHNQSREHRHRFLAA
jgi:hypothetical protein